MSTLLRDARIGIRLLLKNPGFSAVAVLTLALGIAATTVIFSVVHATFFEPLPYRDPDRLVMMWSQYKGQRQMVGPLYFVEWKRQATVFESLDAWGGREMDMASPGGPPERMQVGVATPNWLPMFGYGQPPALGRNFLEHEGRPGHDRVVIITHRLWRERLGGRDDIIGRDIRLNGEPYTVVGVLGAGPPDENQVQLWTPLAFDGYRPTPDYQWGLHVMGRLKPGLTIEAANANMEAVSRTIERVHADAEGWRASVEPFRNNFVPESTQRGLWLLLGAVGVLLLIACANVANLLLARGTARGRELAIRASLGASRWQIVRQLLVESVVLAVIGGALGVALASALLHVVLALMPPFMLPTEVAIRLNIPVLIFALVACMLSGVLAGAAPAWQGARANVTDTLKEGGRSGSAGGGRVRHALIVFEFALALVLLAGGGLAAHALYTLSTRDLGFEADNVLTFTLAFRESDEDRRAMNDPDARLAVFERVSAVYGQILERVQAVPGVVSASASATLPVAPQGGLQVGIAGRPAPDPADREMSGFNMVSPSYFRTLGIPIVHGRALTEGDRRGTLPVVVVNEAFVRRYLAGVDPLTQRVVLPQWQPSEWQIVGVHRDIRAWGPHEERHPAVTLPLAQSPIPAVRVAVRTAGEVPGLRGTLAAIVQSIDPDLPLGDVKTMEQIVAESLVTDRFNTTLFGSFALAGLLLAAVGIYGVLSFVVAQRTHEIGIRMALGAGRGRILRLVVRQGMVLALLGTLVGSIGALAVVRLMRGVIWGVGDVAPTAYVVVALVLLGTALVACLVPAARAANVEPVVALREG